MPRTRGMPIRSESVEAPTGTCADPVREAAPMQAQPTGRGASPSRKSGSARPPEAPSLAGPCAYLEPRRRRRHFARRPRLRGEPRS